MFIIIAFVYFINIPNIAQDRFLGPFRTPSPDLAKPGFWTLPGPCPVGTLNLVFDQMSSSPGAYLWTRSGPWYLPGPGLGPQIGSPPHGRDLADPGSWTPLIGVSEPGLSRTLQEHVPFWDLTTRLWSRQSARLPTPSQPSVWSGFADSSFQEHVDVPGLGSSNTQT